MTQSSPDIEHAEAFEALREIEVAWLSRELGRAIKNLAYPVGCGAAPTDYHLEAAAKALFERYAKMIEMARAAAINDQAATPSMRLAMEEIANRAGNFADDDAAEWMPSIYSIACKALGEDPAPCLKATGFDGDIKDWPTRRPRHDAQAGWKLVPIDPTPEMISAGMGKIPEDGSEFEDIEAAYRAMVGAAVTSTEDK